MCVCICERVSEGESEHICICERVKPVVDGVKVRTAEGGELVNHVSVGHGSDILATAGADLNHSNSSVVLRLAHKSCGTG